MKAFERSRREAVGFDHAMLNGACSYRRFLDGDDDGLAEIIRAYRDPLIFFLNAYFRDLDEAEDAAEEAFIKLAVKKPRYNGKASFKTWLFTIGANVAKDRLRERKRRGEVPIESAADLAAMEDIELSLIRQERKKALHEAMDRLSPEHGRVLRLIYFEDMSAKEAAAVLGKSVHATENLVYKARKALREQLEKEGYDHEDL